MKSDNFNSLEISQVASKRFLGLPYVTVSAHARHLQEKYVFAARQTACETESSQIGLQPN